MHRCHQQQNFSSHNAQLSQFSHNQTFLSPIGAEQFGEKTFRKKSNKVIAGEPLKTWISFWLGDIACKSSLEYQFG